MAVTYPFGSRQESQAKVLDFRPKKKRGLIGTSDQNGIVAASQYAPYPAPSVYRWDFVTENNIRVTERNEPVVTLLRVA